MLATTLAVLLTSAPQTPKALLVIEHRLNALNAATKQMNIEAIADWMSANATKGFLLRTAKGKSLDSREIVQNLEDEFLIIQSIPNCTAKVGNFSQKGARVSCSVVTKMTAMLKGKRKLYSEVTVVDTWRQVNGNWKLAGAVTTHQKTTILPIQGHKHP
ncbi:MAG TPA: hypothetical protein VG944_07700 [Fimbriimonas sp.]|nr:hypothetical protein [Fimbriimonas sp.]